MKTIRQLLTLVVLGALAACPALAANSKAETYVVTGYFDGAKPSPALLAQAADAIGKQMAGMTQVQDAADATHVVEILFKRGQYQVFVDALPLDRRQSKMVSERYVSEIGLAAEMARDAADGHGSPGRH
jgi:hypothetical protein